jgi:hypothetical protein
LPALILTVLLLLASRGFAASFMHGAAEDAYITFRYASNWANGLGPVYNPGERVWGFSSPLWTALLALFAKTGLPLEPATRGVLIAADLVSLVVGMRLLAPLSRAAAWAYGVFWGSHTLPAVLASSGMESGVFWCLMVVAAATLRGNPWVAGATLGFLSLVRPESVLVAAVMALWAPWRARVVALAMLVAGWGSLALYYGHWVPQSVVAKALTYGTPGPLAARHWFDWFVPFLFGRWPSTAEGDLLVPLAVLVLPGLVVGLGSLWHERRSPVAALVAGGLAVLAGYVLVGVTFFYWYMLVPMMAVIVCAVVGLARLRIARGVWASAFLFIVGSWTVMTSLYRGRAQIERELFGRAGVALHSDAGRHGGERRGAPPLVFLEPIGWIGWETGFRVADEVGLVTPWIARRRLQGAGWYADFVNQAKPDYIVPRASMLATGQAFAGAGAPFRSEEERRQVLSGYERFYPAASVQPGPNDLVAMRRLAGR